MTSIIIYKYNLKNFHFNLTKRSEKNLISNKDMMMIQMMATVAEVKIKKQVKTKIKISKKKKLI